MSNKKLIINADDFGWDDFATKSILELGKDQKISSTSIMANFVTQTDLEKLNGLPNISKGLHLNLIEGKPISDASRVRTLTDKEGNFKSQKKLLVHSLLGWINLNELKLEINNQLKFLLDNKVEVSHIDSHKHLHQYPGIGHAILYIIRSTEINKLRKCRPTNIKSDKMKVVGAFNRTTKKALSVYNTPQAIITDFSVNREATNDIFNYSIDLAFSKFNKVEFMTHPATENREGSYLNRKSEYEFWKNENWQRYLDNNKIELISYNEL